MASSQRILALDIGASNLKLAEFLSDGQGGLTLVRYAIESLGLDPQEEGERSRYLVATLRTMLDEQGIRPGPVLVSVAGQSVFSRFVKLPPVEAEKVEKIVEYEAQQNVPFPMDEVVWDYQLLEGSEGDVDVMLAAIKGEIIEEVTQCVTFSGLKPILVDVAPVSLYNGVRFNYEDLPSCTLLVDIGARSTDLVFIEEGRVFNRSIPVAGNAITQQIMREFDLDFEGAEALKKEHAFVGLGGAYEEPESEIAAQVSKIVRSAMTRLHAEINRSINFYRSQQAGSPPEKVLLSGGGSVISGIDEFLGEKLGVDTEYLNPFNQIAVSEDISLEEIGSEAYLLGEVSGLALRRVMTCPIELNLLPPSLLEQEAFARKQPVFLGAMVGLVLVVAVWWGYFATMTRIGQDRLGEVDRQVRALQALDEQLRGPEQAILKIQDNLARISSVVRDRTDWVLILDGIRSVLPDGMWITALEPVESRDSQEEPAEASSRSRRRAPVAEPRDDASPVPASIPQIEITGRGYIDKISSSEPIRIFRDDLRAQTNLFTEATEITWQPQPSPEAFVREFKIMMVLREPLAR